MIGTYDFCGHYEWTFDWLEKQGGEKLLREYWDEAISQDSQRHARALIAQGIEGMKKYWTHTLDEEAADYAFTADDKHFRADMHACPSKGFLIKNGLEQHHDYCDHCMGWIGPAMKDSGFVIDHEHNHHGKCWWEFRKKDDPTPPGIPGEFAGKKDVRLQPDWEQAKIDKFEHATSDQDKTSTSSPPPS
ncbi:MAG: hypothetical protein ACK5LK_10880 [Chthoniobacterales bacterium]